MCSQTNDRSGNPDGALSPLENKGDDSNPTKWFWEGTKKNVLRGGLHLCRILFGQGGLRKGGWAGRDAAGEPEGLVLKAQRLHACPLCHRPPHPLEAAPVAIHRMVLWGRNHVMVPVDGTLVDFTLDNTLSSVIASWHRDKGIASLDSRMPNGR